MSALVVLVTVEVEVGLDAAVAGGVRDMEVGRTTTFVEIFGEVGVVGEVDTVDEAVTAGAGYGLAVASAWANATGARQRKLMIAKLENVRRNISAAPIPIPVERPVGPRATAVGWNGTAIVTERSDLNAKFTH